MRQLGSSIRRRSLLKTGAVATGFAATSLLPSGGFAQAKTQTVNLQLGWLAGNNQVGEVAAKHLGYFEEEKLNVVIHPGGPSIDGVAIVASGRYEIGQVSSSPSLLLAASQGIPVKCFAVGAQQQFAGRRRAHAAAAALEQRHAHLVLEPQDLPVDRRRRDAQRIGCLADRAVARDMIEIAQDRRMHGQCPRSQI